MDLLGELKRLKKKQDELEARVKVLEDKKPTTKPPPPGPNLGGPRPPSGP